MMPSWETLPGETPLNAAMIGQQIAPEDRELVQRALTNAKAAHAPFRCEHRIVRADDEAVRWISCNGTYDYDGDGKPVRFIGVVRDVTDNRRLESVASSTGAAAQGAAARNAARRPSEGRPSPFRKPRARSEHDRRTRAGAVVHVTTLANPGIG